MKLIALTTFFGLLTLVASDCLYNSNTYLGEWKPSSSDLEIPYDAFQGGFATGNKVYICRVDGVSGTAPSSNRNCYTVSNNSINLDTEYEILINAQGVWVPMRSRNELPCNSLIVGVKDMYPTYVSRVPNPGKSINLGYLYRGISYIGFDNIVHEYTNFEVLTLVPKFVQTDYSKFFKLEGKFLSLKVESASKATLYLGRAKTKLVSLIIEMVDQDLLFETRVFSTGGVIDGSLLVNATSSSILQESLWISVEGKYLKVGRDGSTDPVLAVQHIALFYANSVKFAGIGQPLWRIPDLDVV